MSEQVKKKEAQAGQDGEKLLDAIIETSLDAFIAMGADGCITHWNRQSERMFGWLRSDAIGQYLADLIIPADNREAHKLGLSRYLATGRGSVIDSRVKMQALRRSGEVFPIEMTISVFGEASNQTFFTFIHDESEHEKIERELSALARTDVLTDLPNRRHLYERLEETLARVNRTHRLMAVMFMDIDHFKRINDSLGHDVGDALLLQFASRLKASVRQVDFIARLGGDEFIVVAEELAHLDNVITLAQKIIESVAQPFQVNEHQLRITTSIGIASYAGEHLSVDTLIQRADQAMYQAKRSGRNTFRIACEEEIPAKQSGVSGSMAKFFERLPATKELDVNDLLQDALHSIRIHLGMDVAFISEFKEGQRIFRFVDASNPHSPIVVGGSDPLEDSFCQRVIDGRLPELMPDAFLNTHAMSLPITQALPVRAHLSVPIFLKNGEVYGTYCCFSSKADQSMNERDIGMMRVFAEMVSHQLEKTFNR